MVYQMVMRAPANKIGKGIVKGVLILLLAMIAGACSQEDDRPVVKVGIIHSLSGTMAISESPVLDAALLAIDEINESGGVLGHKIEPITADGQSDPAVFAAEAERLIVDDEVKVLFGSWTSASRKAIKPVVEQHNVFLFYPVQYEGLEQSPNIVYVGATANQQIIPAVQWSFVTLGKRFFLVGSDYVFPRAANEIIKDNVAILGGEVVGEGYLLLGSTDVDQIIQEIVETQPDVILNTINGDSNIAFFNALRSAGITPEQIPTISFSIAEAELQSIEPELVVGDYAAWNYFQSIDLHENRNFVESFQRRYGADRVTDDPIEAGYLSVYLWAQAVESAGSMETDAVRSALPFLRFYAPEGPIFVDPNNQHLWKMTQIGRINEQGQFDIVWNSSLSLRPKPYPESREKEEWEQFLEDLYQEWGENWVNPG